jgi:triacylglycerol lipase
MIATLTRLLLLFQLLAAVGIYFFATRLLQASNAIALPMGFGTVILVRLAITANNFLLAWRYRSHAPYHHRIGRWTALMLFFGEFRATMTVSSWHMPFLAFSRRSPEHAEGLPVLLIHGYGCNSGYWHAMSKALLKARIAHHAIDMEPVIGGIDDYVPMIHQAIERLCSETGSKRIAVVAHSMGGLAVRAYLRVHGDKRIAKAITLGTPHHGTVLAHFGVGLNTHQMRHTVTEQEGVASEWLRALAAGEAPSVYRLFVSIYSHHDNIISPQTSSHLEGAKNIEFHAIGHVALALDAAVQATIIHELREASQRELAAPADASVLKPA